jgi:hypothetical protein
MVLTPDSREDRQSDEADRGRSQTENGNPCYPVSATIASRSRFSERRVRLRSSLSESAPRQDEAVSAVSRQGEVHLQHRVAKPKGELAFGRDLIRHQVDDCDLQRTDVLLFGTAAVDRQRAAERRQEGWISWLWMMTGIVEGSLTQTFVLWCPTAAKANINFQSTVHCRKSQIRQ